MTTSIKPQLTIELGGATRTIRFGIPECLALARRLGEKDPLQYVLGGGDLLTFCVEGLFAGMADKRTAKADPIQIGTWLGDWDGDLVELQWDLCYLWARAQPRQRAEALVEMMDRARENQQLAPHKWGAPPPVPTPAG